MLKGESSCLSSQPVSGLSSPLPGPLRHAPDAVNSAALLVLLWSVQPESEPRETLPCLRCFLLGFWSQCGDIITQGLHSTDICLFSESWSVRQSLTRQHLPGTLLCSKYDNISWKPVCWPLRSVGEAFEMQFSDFSLKCVITSRSALVPSKAEYPDELKSEGTRKRWGLVEDGSLGQCVCVCGWWSQG